MLEEGGGPTNYFNYLGKSYCFFSLLVFQRIARV